MSGVFGTVESRAIAISAVALLVLVQPVLAQSPGPSGTAQAGPGEVIIGGPPSTPFQRCIEVQIGDEQAFGCLNQQLKREVDRVTGTTNLPPLDARSPDIRVGIVNEAGVRQQYGSNYGRSVIPFRPPPIPVIPRR